MRGSATRDCPGHLIGPAYCVSDVRGTDVKMLSENAPTAADRRTFLSPLLTVAVLAILLSSCSESQVLRPSSLLVVGDSVAAQSAEALIHLAPEGTTVSVDAVRPGTAPCDWNHGFTDPTDGKFQSFARAFDEVHPAVVAFVFTGNPGLSGPSAGCVDANKPYDLTQLLASYEPALVEMANKATSAGATVYFEAPPPRNPAVPVGYDSQKQENRGFNGSPAIATFYESLATKDSRHWRYNDTSSSRGVVGQPVLDADTAMRGVGRQALHRWTGPSQGWRYRRCPPRRTRVRCDSFRPGARGGGVGDSTARSEICDRCRLRVRRLSVGRDHDLPL